MRINPFGSDQGLKTTGSTAAHLDGNEMRLNTARRFTTPATSQIHGLLSFSRDGKRTGRGSYSQRVLGAGI